MDEAQRAHFDAYGFVRLPAYFDPGPLAREVQQSLTDGFSTSSHRNTGAAATFRYVPMMSERTPISLDLIVWFADIARELLESPIVPGRAKGTEYSGSTSWHRDSDGPVASLGILCYLTNLDERTGALQVVPGSNSSDLGARLQDDLGHDRPVPGIHLATSPGDVIVLDERTLHSSSGGTTRQQWRVDFASGAEPRHDLVRYFAGQYTIGWDAGYDPDRFPSYGPDWRSLDAGWTSRLRDLGVFDLVEAEENFMRRMRR